ncbi:M14 family zinc carboxypeptidase [Lewinella sp. JB7]|uniref:M14 family zinc carboxypeptidase n=1 Tax=Lewinella sp. JB7 TaxID=2962887 RepID=UPI0020C952DA|nr:M14 family zinc carboxypeptidase [Lewinella sp. JB7]MCP9234339.1 zinc carboxypeptidase [Lewinella sp. JB7]
MRLLFFLLLIAPALRAQITTPDDFLPHRLGETFTHHHQLVNYYQRIAQESPRVNLEQYGLTNEDRPLLLATVSTPENLARIEAIRENNLRRAGLLDGATDPALDNIAIVWLSFSVHGNEAAGSEASMGVLYDLANPDNPETSKWLENTVVLLDPSENPDGYNRYTNWYRQMANRFVEANGTTREHREPWPGGRTNHYLFDLNRDWAWQTQVESRQRLVKYHAWMPHIHADLHEQGYTSPYYFAPAAAPYHEYITDWQGDFQTEIGQNHARYFDQNGWLYFTRERFDLLYPSYGDTYPTFNGAIGMTYEQGGGGRGGRAIELPTGDTLTLYDRVAHHRTTALSTVEIASREAERLTSEFADYFVNATNQPQGKYRTYVISGSNAPGKLRALTTLLDRNGIRYGRATQSRDFDGFDYGSGGSGKSRVMAGDLVISAHQPRGVLAQVLFDPSSVVEDSVTYDITAWSIPAAYGLETRASTARLDVTTEPFVLPAYDNPLAGQDVETAYAFALPWEGMTSARYLAALLRAGIRVRTSAQAFSFGDQRFPAGTMIINRGDNRVTPDFAEKLRRLTAEHEAPLTVLQTGFSATIGGDLGSSNYALVSAPKVATLSGEGVFNNEFGQVWYYFEQDLEYPVSVFHREDVNEVFDGDYDVLVLPEGRYAFTDEELSSLTAWVRGGGKLIAIGAANGSLAGREGFGLTNKEAQDTLSEEEKQEKILLPYAGQERRFIAGYIPGAIVNVEMDGTHPLSFGIGDRYASLKVSEDAYAYLENGWNVGRIRAGARVQGFVGNQAYRKIQETLNFGVEPLRRGTVIYLVDNPLYRAFWENGKFLFANALFQVQ